MSSAQDWVTRLGLAPIALGGWFGPAMGSDESVAEGALPARFTGDHPLYSSNWYLLESSQVLGLHQLKQDELWFFHEGSPIDLHVFADDGYDTVTLGADPGSGQRYHGYGPHSTWFGAEVRDPGYALVSCSLAPGWAPTDSSQPGPEAVADLKRRFPDRADLIQRLTHQPHPQHP